MHWAKKTTNSCFLSLYFGTKLGGLTLPKYFLYLTALLLKNTSCDLRKKKLWIGKDEGIQRFISWKGYGDYDELNVWARPRALLNCLISLYFTLSLCTQGGQ